MPATTKVGRWMADNESGVNSVRGPREPITKDALMAIRRPALVIAGARDQLAGPPQGLADAIMGAKAVTIPGCDHFSMIAHGLFKASVFDFFDGWLE